MLKHHQYSYLPTVATDGSATSQALFASLESKCAGKKVQRGSAHKVLYQSSFARHMTYVKLTCAVIQVTCVAAQACAHVLSKANRAPQRDIVHASTQEYNRHV